MSYLVIILYKQCKVDWVIQKVIWIFGYEITNIDVYISVCYIWNI